MAQLSILCEKPKYKIYGVAQRSISRKVTVEENSEDFSRRLGVLEAAGYKNIAHILYVLYHILFIVDSLCNNIEVAPVTQVFVLYVNPNKTLWRSFCSSSRKENELILLDTQIISFRNISAKVFESYQTSNMSTSKWYAFYYLTDSFRQIGNL